MAKDTGNIVPRNYITGAYIISGIMILSNGILFLNLSSLSLLSVSQLILLLIAGNLILADAKKRGLSQIHSLWILLGIIGVIIYDFGFAQNNLELKTPLVSNSPNMIKKVLVTILFLITIAGVFISVAIHYFAGVTFILSIIAIVDAYKNGNSSKGL